MINKKERKYIKEALRLVELTKQDKNYSNGRFDAIIEVLKLSDDVVKNLSLTDVSQQRELLLDFSKYVNGRIWSDNEPFREDEVDEWIANNCVVRTLCDCKEHSIKTNYGFEVCTKCGNEFND